MAVHTVLTKEDLVRLCEAFALGALLEHEGLAAGSINTNYRVRTDRGRYLLTLREGKRADEAAAEIAIVRHLADARYPVARPAEPSSRALLALHGRPALCFPWLPGEHVAPDAMTIEQQRELGAHLARMHVLLDALPFDRENPYGDATVAAWLEELRRASNDELAGTARLLTEALEACRCARDSNLPRGPIHADLFPDNVKWVDQRISVVLDFEMACREIRMLDLAIALLAFTFDEASGDFSTPHLRALVAGYAQERPLEEAERAGLFAECMFAAVRYCASRIRDFELSPLPPERLVRKDYRDYLRRLAALTALGGPAFRARCGL